MRLLVALCGAFLGAAGVDTDAVGAADTKTGSKWNWNFHKNNHPRDKASDKAARGGGGSRGGGSKWSWGAKNPKVRHGGRGGLGGGNRNFRERSSKSRNKHGLGGLGGGKKHNERHFRESDDDLKSLSKIKADDNRGKRRMTEKQRQAAAEKAQRDLVKKRLTDLHAKMDTDGDGDVTFAEITDFQNKTKIESAHKSALEEYKSLKRMNRNKDGKLSFKGLKRAGIAMGKNQSLAKAADADNDGFLTQDEFVAMMVPDLNEDVLAVAVQEALESMDLDDDGKVNRTEFAQAEGDEDFEALDLDKDGSLSAAEITPVHTGKSRDLITLKHILEVTDHDKSSHFTVGELMQAYDKLVAYRTTFAEWTTHHEL